MTGTNRGIGLELVRQLAEKTPKDARIYASCRAPDASAAQVGAGFLLGVELGVLTMVPRHNRAPGPLRIRLGWIFCSFSRVEFSQICLRNIIIMLGMFVCQRPPAIALPTLYHSHASFIKTHLAK